MTAGYGVAPEAEGHGVATEALLVLVAGARASGQVRRVVADAVHDNLASQRVLEKAGFRLIGADEEVRRYALVLDGSTDDRNSR